VPIPAEPTAETSPRRTLILAVAARLTGVTYATGYLGQVGARNALPGVEDTPSEPPTKSAKDLRVQPYFILEPGIGGPHEGEASAAGPVDAFRDIDDPFTVRAAGGDVQDVLALVDRINALLYPPGGWVPIVGGGWKCGPIIPQPGYRPPLLPDHSSPPTRWFAPLQYRLAAHT